GRPEDAEITKEELEGLTELYILSDSGVEDIEGLQYAVNLTTLVINCDVQNIDKISGLTKLVSLSVTDNSGLTDLSLLGSKPELEKLDIHDSSQLTSLDGLTRGNFP